MKAALGEIAELVRREIGMSLSASQENALRA
ncbi:MAG: hypothetical protein QOE91_446, partial [Gaiellaceae bacterium]|nr:hypothetical protein [Gaiellaceae bacterium]